jgi:hypothetical protein
VTSLVKPPYRPSYSDASRSPLHGGAPLGSSQRLDAGAAVQAAAHVRRNQGDGLRPCLAVGEGDQQRGEPGALDPALDPRQPYRQRPAPLRQAAIDLSSTPGFAIPPLAVEVSGIAKPRRRRPPVPAPKIVGEDAPRTSVPERTGR